MEVLFSQSPELRVEIVSPPLTLPSTPSFRDIPLPSVALCFWCGFGSTATGEGSGEGLMLLCLFVPVPWSPGHRDQSRHGHTMQAGVLLWVFGSTALERGSSVSAGEARW